MADGQKQFTLRLVGMNTSTGSTAHGGSTIAMPTFAPTAMVPATISSSCLLNRTHWERRCAPIFLLFNDKLHTASGFLLGIVGFLLVYVLNVKEEIATHMTTGFVALFAFMFALGISALWEIFEFGMDRFFGMDMQKEMLGDPSGLTDTMWDLIVDTVGAATIAIMGFGYWKTAGKKSFLEQLLWNDTIFLKESHEWIVAKIF